MSTRLVYGLVNAAALVEGYTRLYLLRHWCTDVIGGLLLGWLLLVTLAEVTTALAGRPTAAARSGG